MVTTVAIQLVLKIAIDWPLYVSVAFLQIHITATKYPHEKSLMEKSAKCPIGKV